VRGDQFAAIRYAPRLVHHPYDSFAASYEAFVEASADDPDVLAIKSTVYWTGEDAPPVVERAVLEPADVERVAGEVRPPYDAAVLVGAWCYLRPGELLGLERGDVGSGVLNVRGTKTARSRRTVPVPMRAARALSELPVRFGTRLLSPAPRGCLLTPAAGGTASSTGPARQLGFRATSPRTRFATRGSRGRCTRASPRATSPGPRARR
jgi:integrase